jgi:hypothetical protein
VGFLFRATPNGDNTWEPVPDNKIKSASVGAVAVSEPNADVVYMTRTVIELLFDGLAEPEARRKVS